jgi:uncharacterized protein (DUF1810 family)
MTDENSLQRFLTAQETDYPIALAEIKRGRKQSHWMWYIFPQVQGLGYSETARFYAIKNMLEAEAYLNHPVLGKRLIEICEALLLLTSNNATAIFGNPDDLKLRSSMTLFSLVNNPPPVFQKVLNKFFQGIPDPKTQQLIENQA